MESAPSRALILAWLALVGALPAGAQGPSLTQYPESARVMDLIESRERERMHPGDPLKIVGLRQGDNDFLTGLNVASRGDFQPAAVDGRQAYERQLAMVEGGLRFDTPLRRSYLPADTAGGAAAPPRDVAPRHSEHGSPGVAGRDTTWIGMLIAAAACVGLYLTRGNARA